MPCFRTSGSWMLLIAAAAGAVALAGCEQAPPYVPRPLDAPEVAHCNDHTGHKAGSQPIVLGGQCTCTPSDALMARLHADGYCVGMTAAELRAAYEAAGIALRGPGHERCNGLCEHGPHVALGGKCMAPPTPGTLYFERVVFGPPPRLDPKSPQAKARAEVDKRVRENLKITVQK